MTKISNFQAQPLGLDKPDSDQNFKTKSKAANFANGDVESFGQNENTKSFSYYSNNLRGQFLSRKLNDQLDAAQIGENDSLFKKGLDGKDVSFTFTDEELKRFAQMDDPREAITRLALQKAGYTTARDRQSVDDFINSIKNEDGKVAINWRGGDENNQDISVAELKIAIKNELELRRYELNKKDTFARQNEPLQPLRLQNEAGDKKADFFGKYTVSAANRKWIFENKLNKTGTDAERAQYVRDKFELAIDKRIEEAIARLKKQFDPGNSENPFYRMSRRMGYDRALKEEIDRIINETKADFRQAGLGKDIGDYSEGVMRGLLETHPLYRYMPDSVKNELVKFGIGVEKGTISIVAGIKGANDFVNDAITDAAIYGLKKAGVDTSVYEKSLSETREERRKFWTDLSQISTRQMSQADKAYLEKAERGLRLTPYDLPNKSTALGQTVPSLAIGAATGGSGSLATMILVSAATQATLAGGETYITTNDRTESVKAATIAGVQGAVAPVTAKLPYIADVAGNALMTYATGKLQGLDDNKIFESIITQSALSGGFRAGGKLNEFLAAKEGKPSLSIDEAKQAVWKYKDEILQTFDVESKKSFGKNLQESYAKAKAEYGRGNTVFTRAAYEQAGKTLAVAKTKLIAGALSVGGGLGGLDKNTLGALKTRAGFHLESGLRSLADFKKAMTGEADLLGIKLTDADIATLHKQSAETYLQGVRSKLTKAGRAEFEQMRATSKTTTEFVQKLSGDPVKMFESIAQRKAELPGKLELRKEAINKARTQIDTPEFNSRWLTREAVKRNNAPLLREQISIELTKQKLAIQYPATKGYEIQNGVKIYQDSGFSTKADWAADWEIRHPGQKAPSTDFLVESGGKVWQPITDADIAVVKKNADGKNEIVQVEQVKSGKNDTNGEAREQLDNTLDALKRIASNDSSVRIFTTENNSSLDITNNYDLSSINKARAITRGADDRPHFDENLGIDSKQINQLANEILQNKLGGN